MWLFSYFFDFLKMVILELRYSGAEPSLCSQLLGPTIKDGQILQYRIRISLFNSL